MVRCFEIYNIFQRNGFCYSCKWIYLLLLEWCLEWQTLNLSIPRVVLLCSKETYYSALFFVSGWFDSTRSPAPFLWSLCPVSDVNCHNGWSLFARWKRHLVLYLGSAVFASSKAYSNLIGTRQVHSAYKWLWKSNCQPERKIFFWLLLKDRLSTQGLLKRRNMELETYDCVLCHLNSEETLLHLFFSLSFCSLLLEYPGLSSPDSRWPSEHVERLSFSNSEAFVYGSHHLYVLGYLVSSQWQHFQLAMTTFRRELALVKLRAKNKYQPELDQWLEGYV